MLCFFVKKETKLFASEVAELKEGEVMKIRNVRDG